MITIHNLYKLENTRIDNCGKISSVNQSGDEIRIVIRLNYPDYSDLDEIYRLLITINLNDLYMKYIVYEDTFQRFESEYNNLKLDELQTVDSLVDRIKRDYSEILTKINIY